MRLYESEAKSVFKGNKIPTPENYGTIKNLEELRKLKLKFPVMLKANVLIGGRGKAGGIKKANNFEEAKSIAERIFSTRIKDYKVDSIFIESCIPEEKLLGSFYVGVTMNPENYNDVFIASYAGGVDIEEVAKKFPEKIMRKEIESNDDKIPDSAVNELISFLKKGFKEKFDDKKVADVISKVYELYQKKDCKLVEINPLMITTEGPIAADAKIILDDNALYRQQELLSMLNIKGKRHDVAEPTTNELRAMKSGFPYVDLLPENSEKEKGKFYVGLVPGGAGYGIFSIDEVVNIGNGYFSGKVVPVNFMDSGAGPTKERVAEMFHLLMDYKFANSKNLDLIITSRFGGISSCDIFIRGVVQCLRDRYEKKSSIIPVYGRMVGTDLPSARDYLEKAKKETSEALAKLDIVVGNQKIMADVIKEGLEKCFPKEHKE